MTIESVNAEGVMMRAIISVSCAILGRSIGPPVSNKKKHDCICMVINLDILIHPDLTQYVNGLYAEPLACSVGQPTTTSDI